MKYVGKIRVIVFLGVVVSFLLVGLSYLLLGWAYEGPKRLVVKLLERRVKVLDDCNNY